MGFAKSRGFRFIGINLNVEYCQQTVDALA